MTQIMPHGYDLLSGVPAITGPLGPLPPLASASPPFLSPYLPRVPAAVVVSQRFVVSWRSPFSVRPLPSTCEWTPPPLPSPGLKVPFLVLAWDLHSYDMHAAPMQTPCTVMYAFISRCRLSIEIIEIIRFSPLRNEIISNSTLTLKKYFVYVGEGIRVVIEGSEWVARQL